MTLALRLRQAGANVVLMEAGRSTGGLASSAGIGRYTWDRFYHVILMSDLHTRRLLDELGLADRMRWGTTQTGFYTDGKLYSLSNAIEFLRFPPLSLVDKLRLGGTIFLASRIKNWRDLERTLAVDWLTRWSGTRVMERIWLPLLKSKLGDNYQIASAAFIWAIIARMYAARRTGLKREMFGYVDGGYELVLSTLQKRLNELGVQTRTGAAIERIEADAERPSVALAHGVRETFDAVVATVPTSAFARMCPQLGDDETKRLQGVVYQGIICPSLLLRRPLSNYYVTNITDRAVPFTGVIEMTALVDRRAFGGNALVYLPWYLTQDSPHWAKSDDDILKECIEGLRHMYAQFELGDIVATNVSRAKHVLAVSTLHYSERHCPPMVTSLPRVFLINGAQIVAGTLNVNETLGLVEDRLPELLSLLARSPG